MNGQRAKELRRLFRLAVPVSGQTPRAWRAFKRAARPGSPHRERLLRDCLQIRRARKAKRAAVVVVDGVRVRSHATALRELAGGVHTPDEAAALRRLGETKFYRGVPVEEPKP